MAEHLKDLIGSRATTEQLTTGSNEVRPTVTTETIDRALIQTADLISPDFKAWYAKQAYRLGVPRFLGIAADARQGKRPAQLFSYLLKRTV